MRTPILGVVASALLAAPALLAQNEQLRLYLDGPAGELTSGSEFDVSVRLDVELDGVQGWSLGVGHDAAQLELVSAVPGSTTATSNNGGLPNFHVLNTAPAGGAGFTQAAVLNFTQPITLPQAAAQELVAASYRVVADPTIVDPCEPIAAGIAFTNELGQPKVSTLVTVTGESVIPVLENATITVRCPGSLEITRCEGDTENVYLEWAFGGEPTWDFLFLYRDGELLASLEIDATSYTDEGLEPRDYEYTILTFVVDDPANPTLIFAHCIGTVIPVTITGIEPARGDWLGGDTVTVTGTAFTAVEDTRLFFIAAGEEPLELVVVEVIDEMTLTATTPESPRLGSYDLRLENVRGAAELPAAFAYGFVRGEMNSEKPIDISDPSYILTFLFIGGVEPPRCEDSVDVTDDGSIDISDAIILLTYLFLGGDPPRPPFPDPGPDPTRTDPLGCSPGGAPPP